MLTTRASNTTSRPQAAFFRATFVALLSIVGIDATAATRHVSQNAANAVDDGDGVAAPFKTIRYAMSKVEAGDTLIIHGGTYREAIDFRGTPAFFAMRANTSGTTPTVVQGGEGESVTIKGSDVVTGWEALGNGVFVRRGWVANSQQVFIGGVPLQQIGGVIFDDFPINPNNPLMRLHQSDGGIWPGRIPGGVADLTDFSFFYDQRAQNLYVKVPYSDLSSHAVEVSARMFLMYGDSLNYVTIRNLTFMHSNSTASTRAGAVALSGQNLLIDGVSILHADGNGLTLSAQASTVQNSKVLYAGRVGMMIVGQNIRILNNDTSYNNTRGFNKWWEAGGMKCIGPGHLKDSEVSGHRATFNQGDGIWFDTGHDNIRVHDSISAYNSGFGIQYEASVRGYFYNNQVFANGQRGIYLFQSSNSVVAHNLVVSNQLEGIAVLDDARRDSTGVLDLQPKSNMIIGNIVGWNRKTLLLPSIMAGNKSDYNYYIDSSAGGATYTKGGPGAPGVQEHTLPQWQTASSQDGHSVARALTIPSAVDAALCNLADYPSFSDVTQQARGLSVLYTQAPWSSIPAILPTSSAPGPR